jgi:diadenosine tetraphosphate (Ap4A) HIT family hydrolase
MVDDITESAPPEADEARVADCYVCRHTAATTLPPWQRIVRTARWRVVHDFQTALPGWLVVVPERHVTTIAELTPAEAAELGGLLRTLSIALQETVGCVKTYVMQFSEAEGFAHLHFHVVPRAADIPADLEGPHVFGYHGGDPAGHVTEAERDDLAARIGAAVERLGAVAED